MVGVRVSGLASGMDIDSIVKDLMRAERMPLDKIEKEKTTLEWKRDLYREINTAIFTFHNDLFNYTLQSNFQTRSVTSTNEDFVSATAANGAGTGTYTISEVKQLAKAATMISADGGISGENKIDVTKALHSIKDNFAAANSGTTDDPFNWKKGAIQKKTFKMENQGETKLELGQLLKNTSDLSIKVNGKGVKVIFKDSVDQEINWPTDTTDLIAVVDAEGNIEFNKGLNKNDAVEVDFVTDFKEETRNLIKSNKKWQTTMQIDKALVEGSVSLEIAGKKYNDMNGKLVDSENNELGSINYETGTITFKPEFLDTLTTEDNGEFEVKIVSQQHYFTFDAQTHTSEGLRHENFIISGDHSLNDVFKEINNSSLGVMMFYDTYTDRVTITRTETGDFNTPEQESGENPPDILLNGGFLNNVLGFNNGTYNEGQNAIFTINGLETQRTSNTFNVNGVSFTLKNIFDAADGVQPVTLSVNNDSEKLFESIKGFVDKYNEIVGKIEEKLNEPYYKGYAPLSDLEREELTDKQQEKWEEMARSGLLRRDPILSSMITQMRSALFSVVNNNELNPQRTTLSSIGINTTSDFRSAKLEINETRLREAIENDPESVELLFRSGDSDSTFGEKGVVRRLRDILQGTRDRIQARAGSANMTEHQYTIGRQIANFEDRIERFEQRLQLLEDRYYRQFTLMERAIMQSNNQMMQLSQFFM